MSGNGDGVGRGDNLCVVMVNSIKIGVEGVGPRGGGVVIEGFHKWYC